jgi:anti-sigma B factor antagonist
LDLEFVDLGNNIVRVVLRGRLDTPGVDRVETRFAAGIVPQGRHAIVDLSNVSFIASMGLRMFISVARVLGRKQCRMVLLAPTPLVNEVLVNAALEHVMPIVSDEPQALALLAG